MIFSDNRLIETTQTEADLLTVYLIAIEAGKNCEAFIHSCIPSFSRPNILVIYVHVSMILCIVVGSPQQGVTYFKISYPNTRLLVSRLITEIVVQIRLLLPEISPILVCGGGGEVTPRGGSIFQPLFT